MNGVNLRFYLFLASRFVRSIWQPWCKICDIFFAALSLFLRVLRSEQRPMKIMAFGVAYFFFQSLSMLQANGKKPLKELRAYISLVRQCLALRCVCSVLLFFFRF